MSPTRRASPPKKPDPDTGLQLDRELNDTDIYVVTIGGKDRVIKKTDIPRLKGTGIVKIRFIDNDGRNVEHYT